ncbi:plasmid recombination protein [Gordonia sp. 852002-10350_SCH5691597]|uniref:plasmid recombination protein n=1 Tax=Gordonia sp. 852002-10350_SCH5691597 TaxID=1834085 RepID=UPI0007EA387C|nr:plasmid recombination protein [Gordonia sp. 852002-10350_SCH5691597]OBA64294.1 hypothetical protein A5777_22220 [Gordonia sp. 852002-10350_SCH5691597]
MAVSATAAGWSTSARWEGCTRSTAVPRIRHILRDVEEQQGLYRAHSNELIDPAMTSANFSFRLAVAEDGSLVKERITDVDSVFEHLNDSLERVQRYRTVPEFRMVVEKDENGQKIPEVDDAGVAVLDKKGQPVYRRRKVPMPNAGEKVPVAMSKDTVVAVEELFQLDPEWTGSSKEITAEKRTEIQELYDVWYADLVDQYGASNVLCVSEHWDETSPHVSAFCMPLAERADGTAELNAKLFTTGTKKPTRSAARQAYVAKHDRLRAALREHGYEAAFERITPRDAQGFAEKGAPLANFKRAAKRATAEERAALDQRETALTEEAAASRVALEDREAEIDAAAVARTAALDQREADLDQREAEIPRARAAAVDEGRAEGRAEGRRLAEQARADGYRDGHAAGVRDAESETSAMVEQARADRAAAAEAVREAADLTPAQAAQLVVDDYTTKSRDALKRYPVRKVDYDETGKPHRVLDAKGQQVITTAWEQMQTDTAHAPGPDLTVGQVRRDGAKLTREIAADSRAHDGAQQQSQQKRNDRGIGL